MAWEGTSSTATGEGTTSSATGETLLWIASTGAWHRQGLSRRQERRRQRRLRAGESLVKASRFAREGGAYTNYALLDRRSACGSRRPDHCGRTVPIGPPLALAASL